MKPTKPYLLFLIITLGALTYLCFQLENERKACEHEYVEAENPYVGPEGSNTNDTSAIVHAPDGYYFPKYQVVMHVHDDNSYSVTERINADFLEESHGLFRMIPTSMYCKRDFSEAQDGSEAVQKQYDIGVYDVSVSEEFVDEGDLGSVRSLRIGSADKLIKGHHSYEIKYTCDLGNDEIPQGDLFFHSVLGTGWDCDIDTFQFVVHFDSPLTEAEMDKLQIYCGPEGSSTNFKNQIILHIDSCSIAGTVTNLAPQNGVTLYIPLHEGYFSGVFHNFYVELAYIAVIIAIIIFAFVLFSMFKPREDHITKVISFHPPKDMSSAAVGAFYDASIDNRDIVSLIPWFASLGMLTIDNTGDKPVIRKKTSSEAPSGYAEETLLYNALFANGDTLDLSQKTSQTFGEQWIKCMAKLNTKYVENLLLFDSKALTFHLYGAFITSLALCWATFADDGWLLGGVTTFASLVLVLLNRNVRTNKCTTAIIMALVNIAGLYVLGMLYSSTFANYLYVPRPLVNSMLIMMGLSTIFIQSLWYFNPIHLQRLGIIQGLEEFIKTAEKEQLEQLQTEDEQYFYKILPYAVAFGLAERWADKFKDLHVTQSENFVGKSATSSIYQFGRMDRTLLNTSHLMSGVSSAHAARAAAAARSSSGSGAGSSRSYSSGGHGHSGGGSGGGGGGRW